MNKASSLDRITRPIKIALGPVTLDGDLAIPDEPCGIVLFAHGSGSSRFSPRNRFVAGSFADGGLATLLLDLLTPKRRSIDVRTRQHRFDIGLLAERLVGATDWSASSPKRATFPSATLARAPAAAAAWSRPRRGRRPSAPWFRVVAGPTLPARLAASAPRRC